MASGQTESREKVWRHVTKVHFLSWGEGGILEGRKVAQSLYYRTGENPHFQFPIKSNKA